MVHGVSECGQQRRSDFLQILLRDQMLNIRPTHHEPLPLLKIDAPQLRLYDPTIPHYAHEHVKILWRINNARHDIQLVAKISTVLHHRRAVRAQKIDLVRGQARAQVGVAEQVWQRAARGPVEVA